MKLTARQMVGQFKANGVNLSVVEVGVLIKMGKIANAIVEVGRVDKEAGMRGRKEVIYEIPDSFTVVMCQPVKKEVVKVEPQKAVKEITMIQKEKEEIKAKDTKKTEVVAPKKKATPKKKSSHVAA